MTDKHSDPEVRLSTYRAKRDRTKTPEPMGARTRPRKSRPSAPRFVIQEHHARALHWDLRLEHDGVFVSWALPKGVPTSPGTNHLAVHTEDHPLEYGGFEGEIPKGEYGGGNVTIWDRGTYDLEKWADKEVKVVLHGERAAGRYVLFATGGKNWMIHRMDPPPEGFEPMPRTIAPMLAVLSAKPPEGPRVGVRVQVGRGPRGGLRGRWPCACHEPEQQRFDSELPGAEVYRRVSRLAVGNPRRRTGCLRRECAAELRASPTPAARRLAERSQDAATRYPPAIFAFDVLYLEGRSLLARPYDERRSTLESLNLSGESFATPPSFTGNQASDVLSTARDRGLEGVVAKRRTSPYSPGSRNGDWVKVKNFHTQEVVVGGWTDGRGSLEGSLGALLVGIPSSDGLTYAGKVGTGFDAEARQYLLRVLKPIGSDSSPFSGQVPKAQSAGAHFVKPVLVGEVQYGEWTREGHLRHPSWRGLRPDKAAGDVIREE